LRKNTAGEELRIDETRAAGRGRLSSINQGISIRRKKKVCQFFEERKKGGGRGKLQIREVNL